MGLAVGVAVVVEMAVTAMVLYNIWKTPAAALTREMARKLQMEAKVTQARWTASETRRPRA
jgi:hypothetical protein